MSRCGSCPLYWAENDGLYGITCEGDCDAAQCADALQSLVFELLCIVQHQKEAEQYADNT